MSDTKFILVGGYPHKAPDGGKAFYKSLVKDSDKRTKILVCLFARPQENWPKAFQQDKDFFALNLPEVPVEMRMATREGFMEELAWCDSVYFRGGDIDLTAIMAQYPHWQDRLQGKVVAGSSMGADMLSSYYFNIVTNIVEKGSGTTSAKVIVHWRSPEYKDTEWEEGYVQLQNTGEDLPIYKLAEGAFVEIT